MSTIKTKEEIDILRESGRRLASIMSEVAKRAVPGVPIKELDRFLEAKIREGGDTPAFLNYKPAGAKRPFPSSLCVSINDEAVHGIPTESDRVLQSGDLVSLDAGLSHRGLISDMCVTVAVGDVEEKGKKLMEAGKHALNAGIKAARGRAHLGDIGAAIEESLEGTTFSVIPDLGGHGVGHQVHEPPHIFHVGQWGTGSKLEPGMVITIEPTVSEGSPEIVLSDDGYTYTTDDGSRTVQFEHTILITEGAPEILTMV